MLILAECGWRVFLQTGRGGGGGGGEGRFDYTDGLSSEPVISTSDHVSLVAV